MAQVNAALATLQYTGVADYHGGDSLSVDTNDGAGSSDSDTVAITVTPVNDPPVITSNGGGATAGVSLAENTAPTTTVTASDVDGATLGYAITGGADAAHFQIDSSTGALSFVATPDFENPTDAGADNVYEVAVSVTDGSLTDTQAIAVTVTNVNDTAPVISSNGGGGTASVSIDENGTTVTTVTATDTDGPPLTYSIVGGSDATLFQIDTGTGALGFLVAPDFENPADTGSNNVYDVTVQASDGSLADIQAIAVTVTNANDNAPVITSNGGSTTALLNIAENGTTVTTVAANDLDNSALTYAISGGPDAALFQINSSTGMLSFLSTPDFENPTDVGTNNIYNVTVLVSDGTATDTQNLGITVTDVNDNAPVITSNGGSATASISIAESGTAVTTATASDLDGPSLAFSIVGGADAALFQINGSSGNLQFVSAPDFENPQDTGVDNVYDVQIQVSDGSFTDTQALAVTVTDMNDNVPNITSDGGGTTASVSVLESTAAVTTVLASDSDTPALVYSISGGADAALFQIDGSSGALRFVGAPDFEIPQDAGANNVYDVQVQVGDGSFTTTQVIAVTVTNTNDNAPVITSQDGAATAPLSIAENTSAVSTLAATDADGDTLRYGIVGGADAGLFTMDSRTGVLRFAVPPDHEAARDADGNNAYEVIVQVSDGLLDDTQALTVTVTDANEGGIGLVSDRDAAPDRVAENATTGATVGITVQALDADANAVVSYSLVDDAGGRFAIHPLSGVVTVADGARVAAMAPGVAYDITVQVQSSDGSVRTAVFTVRMAEDDIAVPEAIPLPPALVDSPVFTATVPAPTGVATATAALTTTEATASRPDVAPSGIPEPDAQALVTVASGRLLSFEVSRQNLVQPLPISGLSERRTIALLQAELLLEEAERLRTSSSANASNGAEPSIELGSSRGPTDLPTTEPLIDAVWIGSTALSLGVAIWATRGGAMLASMLATTPVWQNFDPVPVLSRTKPNRGIAGRTGDAAQGGHTAADKLAPVTGQGAAP